MKKNIKWMHSDKENRWVVNIVKNLEVVGEGVSQRLSLSEKDEEQSYWGTTAWQFGFSSHPTICLWESSRWSAKLTQWCITNTSIKWHRSWVQYSTVAMITLGLSYVIYWIACVRGWCKIAAGTQWFTRVMEKNLESFAPFQMDYNVWRCCLMAHGS